VDTSKLAVSTVGCGRGAVVRHSGQKPLRPASSPECPSRRWPLARGLNANLLRRWVLQAERGTLLVPTRTGI